MWGKSDEEQLEYVFKDDRVLVTFDTGFIPLAIRWLSAGKHFTGVVVSREIKGEQIGELVKLCSRFLSQAHQGETADHVFYLQQFGR